MRKGNGGIIGPLNTPTQAVAGGMWSMDEQQQNLGARQWPGTPAASVPGMPSISFFSFTASISGTTMTVTATGGALAVGQSISGGTTGNYVSQYTIITAQLTGTSGSTGTYTVSLSQTVTSTSMAATVSIASITASTSSIQIPFGAAYPNGSAVTGYTAKVYAGSSLVGTASGASSPLTVTGLANSAVYAITVYATNAVGDGTAQTWPLVKLPSVPAAPTIGTATGSGATTATVEFTPSSNNGSTITSFTAVSSPGGLTGSGATSPITVTGLTTGVAYTFTVTATNVVGAGAASAASNSATPVAPSAGGGTVTYDGAYTLRAFTTTGTLTIAGGAITCDVLVVGGGGPGGYLYGGGGGAGGMIFQTAQSLAIGSYTVTVGAGGPNPGAAAPSNGAPSSLGSIYAALGGGFGGPAGGAGTLYQGGSGGSGGGGQNAGGPGPWYGLGLQPSQSGLNAGFGNNGAQSANGQCAGGGADASPVNTNDTTRCEGGLGKLATGFETYGTNTSNSTAPSSGKGYFAGGGGGTISSQTVGSRGGGGGYISGVSNVGQVNTGGGGAGGFPAAAGGSGIVIIRYLT